MNRAPLLALLLCAAAPSTCWACAAIGDEPIRITEESALIVWDAKTKTEHFVRQANFQTEAKNFGFLVPTPSQPQLAAVGDEVFTDLEAQLLPKTKMVTQSGLKITPLIFALVSGLSGGNSEETSTGTAANVAATSAPLTRGVNDVEVVGRARVGDYNASILRASDTPTLAKWLSEHDYHITPAMRQWLASYVKAGYYLTAFQIASDASGNHAQAKAVRLSFKSDAPFYPYREPTLAQQVKGERALRVFYVGDNRVAGRIEDKEQTQTWDSEVEYSGALDAKDLQKQGIPVPEGDLRLTTFIDESSPRPGWGDLRFAPSKEQDELTPEPNIVYEDKRWWVPFELLVVGLAVGLSYARRFLKRNSTESPNFAR